MDLNQNLDLPQSQELIDTYMFRLPRSYRYAGYIWPGLILSPEHLHDMRDFMFCRTDVVIASYPKSGTTWASEIVSLICNQGDLAKASRKHLHERVPWLEMDDGFLWVRFFWLWQVIAKMLGIRPRDKDQMVEAEKRRRVFFTHLPLELLPRSALDSGCKIIYVSRNPKDNAVSFYHFHQMARFLGQQKGGWNEFFCLYSIGAREFPKFEHTSVYCGSWFEHVLSFWELSKVHSNVLFMKYEDMKLDLRGSVVKMAKFIDEELSGETIETIVDRCQFESMRSNRMTNREGIWLFNQNVSSFMRKGTVGDWKNYFTVAQSEFFDKLYAEKMKGSGLSFEFELPSSS